MIPRPPATVEQQRAKVRDLYRRYAEQVRGPACCDDTLWHELCEAQRQLRELESNDDELPQ